jgi:hypothetical protein
MTLKDLNQLSRFETEANITSFTLVFGVYGTEVYNDIRIHGLLKTLFFLSDINQKKLLQMINDF